MKITYLYHSGFVIETTDTTIIVDYWRDTRDGEFGYVYKNLLSRPGQLYVLASHFHPDHFTPEVLTWRKKRPSIIYILSKDIYKRRHLDKSDAVFLIKGDSYEDDHIRVKAYGSTDSGISFLITIDGKIIFHAGDLNNWHWNEECAPADAERHEKAFLGELKIIRKDIEALDIVFFPVDQRLGKDYWRGPIQFLEHFSVGLFIPMHFSENGFESIRALEPFATQAGTRFWKIHKIGEQIRI